MSSDYQDRKNKLERTLTQGGEFVTLEDGYVYYWPRAVGALDAELLRMISYILDDKNIKWGVQVEEDLGKHK